MLNLEIVFFAEVSHRDFMLEVVPLLSQKFLELFLNFGFFRIVGGHQIRIDFGLVNALLRPLGSTAERECEQYSFFYHCLHGTV